MAFQHFSEAAQLYADNWAVVDAMRTAFDEDVDAFLDAVEDEVRALVAGDFQQKRLRPHRYWWLGEEGVDKDRYPQLWLKFTDPDIVTAGRLTVFGAAPNAGDEELGALRQLPQDPGIADFCKPAKGGNWSLFECSIEYPEAPIAQSAAAKVAKVLTAMSRTIDRPA